MILATVGTQLPFTRLIRALDDLAPILRMRIVAQIGQDAHVPKNIEWCRDYEPSEFQEIFLEATTIVSHAGMGTILAAKKHQKPIVVMPRMAALGEHRNDHQLATAKQLEGHRGIYVANDVSVLADLLSRPTLEPPVWRGGAELETLRNYLRDEFASRLCSL